MSKRLTVGELQLMIDKYVSERTLILGFFFDLHAGMHAKVAGWVDSVTGYGVVVRNERGEFLRVDVSGCEHFELGDRRDLPQEIASVAEDYVSSLSLVLPSGGILTIFEPKS